MLAARSPQHRPLLNNQCHRLLLGLLGALQTAWFFNLDEEYPLDDAVGGAYLIRVQLPGDRKKQVLVDMRDSPPPFPFAQAMGAIILVAGAAHPDALNQRFLSAI